MSRFRGVINLLGKVIGLIQNNPFYIPNILLKNYRKLNISDSELIILIYLINTDNSFNPKLIAKDLNFNLNEVMDIISSLTEKDIFAMVIEHDKPRDWSFKKTDEELKPFIADFYKKNSILLKECSKYGFKYFDTSKNREEVLNKAFEYICENVE